MSDATGDDREVGWNGMFVAPDDDPRTRANFRGEHATLTGYLGNYRKTLELKCQGLDPVAMAAQSVPPSNLSLLGLVRHLASVERFWFRRVLAQQDAADLEWSGGGRHSAFSGVRANEECVSRAWAAWRQEVEFAEGYLAGVEDVGASVPFPPGPSATDTVEVRDVVVHMIEEYARHMGHADLLRECIDGRAGQ